MCVCVCVYVCVCCVCACVRVRFGTKVFNADHIVASCKRQTLAVCHTLQHTAQMRRGEQHRHTHGHTHKHTTKLTYPNAVAEASAAVESNLWVGFVNETAPADP